MESQRRVHVQGTPYVSGLVSGVLQRGMDGLGAGKLCVLSHKDIGLLVQGLQADEQALARKFHGAGIIAVGGAPLSHGMIRLFSLGVPTVIVSRWGCQVRKGRLAPAARNFIQSSRCTVFLRLRSKRWAGSPGNSIYRLCCRMYGAWRHTYAGDPRLSSL